jgi:hypothetical protein
MNARNLLRQFNTWQFNTWFTRSLIAGFATLSVSVSYAQEFAALVTPPRVEASVDAGKTLRQVLEISHVGSQTAKYKVYTADWTFAADGTVTFFEPLQPNSCRPWVALERRELTLAPQGKHRFRFEVAAPADAPAGECRFAVMIEGSDINVNTKSGVSFPMAGRIGVIVYATIGKGAPNLEIVGTKTQAIDGHPTPVLEIRNTGNAHTRLSGILNAKDSSGATFELTPNALPILAGETRQISLVVTSEDKIAANARFPITVIGTLEWADKKTPLNATFSTAPTVPAPTSKSVPTPTAIPAPATAPSNVETAPPNK